MTPRQYHLKFALFHRDAAKRWLEFVDNHLLQAPIGKALAIRWATEHHRWAQIEEEAAEQSGSSIEFICPQCGSQHFGRDTSMGSDGVIAILPTVRCHGCTWRGTWPPIPTT